MSVRIVSASAGSGKTHRLSMELSQALKRGARPEGVVALTYTRKAASELEARLRRELLSAGKPELAARIREGYLGTIHAVCERLCREFALDAGLSPELSPLPESLGKGLFDRALALSDTRELVRVARQMAMKDPAALVKALVDAARVNGLDEAAIQASGERSLASLRAALPRPRAEGDYFEGVVGELSRVLPKLLAEAGASDAAAARAEKVSQLLAACARGLPPWNDQVAVARALSGTKRLGPLVGPLCELIDSHVELRAFQEDLFFAQKTLFTLAAKALSTAARQKAVERVVDFGDMLVQALEILHVPSVREALSSRLDLVLVDEFQDVSPLQLALVSALADLAKESVWVGDRKQAIFGFQGGGPELMEAAFLHAAKGEAMAVLGTSYRSRAPLVEFTSAIFVPAFAAHGHPEAQVRLVASASDLAGLAEQPVLELWRWETGSVVVDGAKVKPTEPCALAAGIAAWFELDDPPKVRCCNADGTEGLRPLTHRDIAVIARRNSVCREVAAALRPYRIPALVQEEGLLSTPEALLCRAAIGLLADSADGVAALEVAWLTGAGAADPDAWLSQRFTELSAWRAARALALAEGRPVDPKPLPFDDAPAVHSLRALDGQVRRSSPTEALDLALRALDLPALLRRWPDPERRIGNLEALRHAARDYEELCLARRVACTTSGLALHLAEAAEETPRALVAEADAVTVTTWHKAKGLEWPVVIVADLDWEREHDPFEVTVEAADSFDAALPLAGRWLRYWPWPYGNHRTGLHYRDLAASTPQAEALCERERRERLRLLYVAFTRPRDLLVLAVGAKRDGPLDHGLAALVDAQGHPTLELPYGSPCGLARATAGARHWPCAVRVLDGLPLAISTEAVREARWYTAARRSPRPPEPLNPSVEPLPEGREPPARGAAIDLGGRIALQGSPASMEALGLALHAFLAADPFGGVARREAIALRLLVAHGVAGALDPAAVVRASDRLRAALLARWPSATWRREWPVRARLSVAGYDRLLVGEVDLVLVLQDGFIVVDHKSFPGSAAEAEARALGHAPQLEWYALALERALQRPALGLFIHLPLVGKLIELARDRSRDPSVPRGGIEPPTRGFSVLCSTD